VTSGWIKFNQIPTSIYRHIDQKSIMKIDENLAEFQRRFPMNTIHQKFLTKFRRPFLKKFLPRWKITSIFLLRDILRGNLDFSYLLGQKELKVPGKRSRARTVLAVRFVRTTQAWHAPVQTIVREYNALTGVQPELDVFHGSRKHYGELVSKALQLLNAE